MSAFVDSAPLRRGRVAWGIVLVATWLSSCGQSDRASPLAPSPGSPAGPAAPIIASTLDGSVHDTAGRPIDAATVEILSGAHAGTVVATGPDGRFTFAGFFTAIPRLQARKAGYLPAGANLFLVPGMPTIRGLVRLGSSTPPMDLGGAYQVTFTADPACSALPPAARSRTYVGTLPSGPLAVHQMALTGATFIRAAGQPESNRLTIGVFENVTRVDFSDPPLWEQLEGATSLVVSGTAEGAVTGSVTSLRVGGQFTFCGTTVDGACEDQLICRSSDHTLVLNRR